MKTFLFLLLPCLCAGAVSNPHVLGVTATQAVIGYTAPGPSACEVEVSENPSYSPIVNDVNSALFSGANLDNREGILNSGRSRIFVVGKRAAEKGDGGRRYSRALQTNTLHYYRITCGADVATGTFQTSNLPLGMSYNDPLPADPQRPGDYAWPSLDWTSRDDLAGYTSNETIIDPQTGILLRRATAPRDRYYGDTVDTFDSVQDPAGAWSTENAVLSDADGGAGATYVGTASPQPWLYLFPDSISGTIEAQYQLNRLSLDYLKLNLKSACLGAGCSSASEDDRKVEACLTVDGVTCEGRTAELILPPDGSEQTYTLGDTATLMSFWTSPGEHPISFPTFATRSGSVTVSGDTVTRGSGAAYFGSEWVSGSRIIFDGLTRCTIQSVDNGLSLRLAPGCPVTDGPHDYAAPNFGVMLRKKTSSPHQIKIQYASLTYGSSWNAYDWTAAGDATHCSATTVNDAEGTPGYHCIFSGEMYWIDPANGETRLVSRGYIPGGANWSPQWCNLESGIFDPTNANAFYCSATSHSGATLLLKAEYTGDNTALPGHSSNTVGESLAAVNLSAGTDIETLIQAFDPSYDPTKFSCSVRGEQTGSLVVSCTRGGQDTLAWTAVYDIAANAVIAASNSWSKAPQRWCVSHGASGFGASDWAQVGTNSVLYTSTTAGKGPFQALITSGAVPGYGSGCPARPPDSPVSADEWPDGSDCTQITVDGEPCDSSPNAWETDRSSSCGETNAYYLQDAIPGDNFKIDSEFVRLLVKDGNTWTIERGRGGGRSPESHYANSKINALCGGLTLAYNFNHGNVFWNYSADPHADNVDQTTVLTDPYFVTQHWAYHNDTFFESASGYPPCADVPSGDCYQARQGTPSSYVTATPKVASMNPQFNDVSGVGNSLFVQTHAGLLQTDATDYEKQWALDGRPLLYTSNNANLLPGMSQVYSITGVTLDRKTLPTVVSCGKAVLRDVSAPNTATNFGDGPAHAYKYCVANQAGECLPDSSAGSIYLNCPQVAYTGTGTCKTRLGAPSYELNDICVSNQGAHAQSLVQVGFGRNDLFGGLSRVLSKGMSRYKLTTEFWAFKSLPDASWGIIRAEWLDKARTDVFLAKIPPYPPVDSVNRGDFVPIPVRLKPPGGIGVDNVVIEFGYAENGDPDSYYCTSRREACVKGNEGGDSYSYASESTGGAPCATGCTLNVPAIPQRILYYRALYRDALNSVVAEGNTQIVVTP